MALELYCRGFFEASALLLDACARNAAPVDTVFYPSVFLFRHGLELAFKALHAAFRQRRGDTTSAPLAGHALAKLWAAVREDVENYVEPSDDPGEDPDATLLRVADVDKVVAELEELDASGEAFRYDRSRRGETHLPQVNSVDLPQLRDVVAFVSGGILDLLHRADVLAEAALHERIKQNKG
ncbi:MAG: hypothetical protein AB1938_16040 [Myxococcota bacterium]